MKNGFTPCVVMLGCRRTKSSHGRATFMKRLSILAAGLLMGAAAVQFSSVASGQSDGWMTLRRQHQDGRLDRGRQSQLGDEGRRAGRGQDRRGQGSFLSRQQEFLQGFPDQGRVLGRRGRQQRHLHPLRRQSAKIDSKVCYEVNIFDKRPDPTYGTGAIVDVAKVDPMPKAGGKWNTFEITAQGLASRRRAQRPEDRRRAGQQAQPADRSRCNTAPAWSSSARCRSSRCRPALGAGDAWSQSRTGAPVFSG